MLGLNGKLLDFIYPVGSYYETSDTSFNPNTAWGGTWIEDTKGRVTVALDSEDTDFSTIGKTGGSKELQQHTHAQNSFNSWGAGVNVTHLPVDAVAGTTSSNQVYMGNRHTLSAGTGDSGNLQPYVVVKRWHRTA